MPVGVFATYKTGENRVTASILAVLQSLSLSRMERLLGALTEESGFELVRFRNQPSKGHEGVPDAEIHCSSLILLETKIKRGTVRAKQLRQHLKRFQKSKESAQWLLVLTPDANRPRAIEEVDDERLVWSSFSALDQAIDDLLEDKNEVISEREAFLLRELQTMLAAEKLVGSAKDVVVVAASRAWAGYLRWNAYICQPNRAFREVTRIAFYANGQIQPLIPAILEVHDEVVLDPALHTGPLGDLVKRLVAQEPNRLGNANKVYLLTPPEHPETHHLVAPVVNDLMSAKGTTIAFTQSQRYVTLSALERANSTSDLISD